jgi:iron complex outermembrane receptor protein
MLDRKLLFGTTIMVGFAAAAIAATPTAAFAQAQPTTTPNPTSSATKDDETADANTVEALVITGSRIKRTEFTSSAPISVITAETSELEGLVDTAQILQGSPLAVTGAQFNNQLTGFITDGGPGANTISLRGLGTQRTLVLLNGRRVAPAGTRGTVGPVDLNTIPNAIIDRVEILKDGASSIYGSDAVAGVVNFITKTNFDGGEVSAFADGNPDGGGEQIRFSGSWGKTFERGYFNATGDYYERKILRRGDREDTRCSPDYLFDPVTHARLDFGDTYRNYSQFKCYNTNLNYLSTGAGNLMYPVAGTAYPTRQQGNNAPIGSGLVRWGRAGFPMTYPYAPYDDPAIQNSSVISPVKRYSLFFSGGFDLTPTVELYGQALFNRRESVQYGSRQFFPGINLANPGNSFGATLGSITVVAPAAYDRHQDVNFMELTGGIRGDFGSALEGWDWDIYAQYGRSDADYGGKNFYNDRVLATTGASGCNQAILDAGPSGGQCSDLTAFIPWTSARIVAGQFNANEASFLTFDEAANTVYTQAMIEGSASGDLFELPAGPIGAAVGFQLRREKINDMPGLNERSGNLWGFSAAGHTAGSDDIKEAFGELEIPVAKGLPGVESFDVQLSGRYTDYKSYGSDSTYKIGLNWQIVPSFRLRATKGTSFRAPALYELYLANQTGFSSQASVDPCVNWGLSLQHNIQTNCAAAGIPDDYNGVGYTLAGIPLSTSSSTIITGGGAGVLKAETSDAKTIGAIWTPSFMDLSVVVDYFDIDVQNEVRRFGAGNIAFQCYNSNNYPADPFCSLLTRGNTGAGTVPWQITQVRDSYVNIAEQWNRGVDLTIRYTHEFDLGKLTVEGQFTWQLEDQAEILGGVVEDCNGQTYGGPSCSTLDQGGPDFAGSLNFRFDHGNWTGFWGMDFIGKGSDTESFGGDTFTTTKYSSTCRFTPTVGAVSTGNCSSFLNAGGTVIVPGTLTVLPVADYFKQYTEFYATHDISLRYKADKWTFQGGIQNVFDDRPPSQSTGQFKIGSAALNAYDMVGRRAFIQVTRRW